MMPAAIPGKDGAATNSRNELLSLFGIGPALRDGVLHLPACRSGQDTDEALQLVSPDPLNQPFNCLDVTHRNSPVPGDGSCPTPTGPDTGDGGLVRRDHGRWDFNAVLGSDVLVDLLGLRFVAQRAECFPNHSHFARPGLYWRRSFARFFFLSCLLLSHVETSDPNQRSRVNPFESRMRRIPRRYRLNKTCRVFT